MTDQENEYQSALVGPGKRFKNQEALELAKQRSDEYIKVLERNLDEYREDILKKDEELKTKASMDDLYDRIVDARRRPLETPPQREATSLSDIEKLIERRFEAAQRASEGRSNMSMVRDKIQEKLGNDYKDSLKKRIEYLDLTQEEADNLAATKPKTFLKMLGLDTQEGFQSPPSNTNMSSTKNAEQKRTWTYYQDLKKSNPSLYYNPKTNLQMLEDYRQLGTDFEDGNFKQYGDSLNNR